MSAARPAHITPEFAGIVVEQLLEGVAALHARKLPHGDIRPGNIYLDEVPGEHGLPVTWIGDPVLGALQFRSGNHIRVPDREAYYRVDVPENASREDLLNADLYALARTACDLALPNVDEVLEECPRASSSGTLWAACNGALRTGGRADVGWTDRLRSYIRGEYLPRRRLTATIAILLGEPPPRNRLWSWLMSWLVPRAKAPADAVEVIDRLRSYDQGREMAKHRLLAASALALALFGLAFALAVSWGRRQDAIRRQREADIAAVTAKLDKANGEIVARDSDVADLRHRLDEKEASDRARQSVREPVNKKQPKGNQEDDKIRLAHSNAEDAWRATFRPQPKSPLSSAPPYEKAQAQKLYVVWRNKDGKVAALIKEWKQGQKDNGGCDELLRLAKPWLDADSDSDLKRLCDEACREPWEKLDKANERLDTLRTAAIRWEQCVDPAVDAQEVIAVEPNDAVKKVLSTWYQKLLTTSPWTVQLTTGRTALNAGYDKSRRISLYAGSVFEGLSHEWEPDIKGRFESWYQYEKNNSRDGKLSFDWKPGDPIKVYVEDGWHYYTFGARPNLIEMPFDGKLAIWAFDQAQVVKSADGKTKLWYRVVRCPGPPRDWKVNRTTEKKIKDTIIKAVK